MREEGGQFTVSVSGSGWVAGDCLQMQTTGTVRVTTSAHTPPPLGKVSWRAATTLSDRSALSLIGSSDTGIKYHLEWCCGD